jgi:glycosyltransferase involved in cell wall biosynthesis
VYGSENIEYRLFEDQAKFDESVIKKVLFKSQVERLKREEISFYKTADSILTVTASEKDVVESFTNNPCFVIPNGVDIQLFLAKEKQPDSSILLFVGNFTYFPNIDAMRFFFSHIFSQLPKNVQLIIVGKNASRLDFLQGEERISILDYIEDIREVYRKASVFVSPIRVGGGTNFKVLEAMACGVPVVALANRVKDFNFTDGKELLIARTADEFIRKLTKLLSDYDLRKQLAKNARIAVEKYYNWENIGEKLYNVWRQTMDERN